MGLSQDGARLGAAPAPDVVTVMRPNGNPLLLAPADAAAPVHHANPVKLKSTLIEMPAVLAGAVGRRGARIGVTLSGGNIDAARFAALLAPPAAG